MQDYLCSKNRFLEEFQLVNAEKNLSLIYEKLQAAADYSNRDLSEITLVGISKGQNIEKINSFIEAGLTNIGESYIQEAVKKFSKLSINFSVKKHFIGRLQRNKVNKAINLFDIIVVDRLNLIIELQKRLEQKSNRSDLFPIILQVNLSNEPSKSGCLPEDTYNLLQTVFDECSSLTCSGLMTIAPITAIQSEEKLRRFYQQMKQHYDNCSSNFDIKELSMGMSNSFEIAIEEGATIVRIGTKLFGPRSFREREINQ